MFVLDMHHVPNEYASIILAQSETKTTNLSGHPWNVFPVSRMVTRLLRLIQFVTGITFIILSIFFN